MTPLQAQSTDEIPSCTTRHHPSCTDEDGPVGQGGEPDGRAHSVHSQKNNGPQEQGEGDEDTYIDGQGDGDHHGRHQVVHESNTDSEVSEAGTQKKRKRKEQVSPNLTIENEEPIVEWLREHPEMYDKRMTQ